MGSQKGLATKPDRQFVNSLEKQFSKSSSNCSLQGKGERLSAFFEYDHRKKVYRCKETKAIVSLWYVLEVAANGISR